MRLRSTELAQAPFPTLPHQDAHGIDPPFSHESPDVDPLVAVITDPYAPVAIQARDIRSTLSALRLPDGSQPSSIALIGVDADDETAVLTANVAASAALSGLRTLLVDMPQSGFIQHRLLRTQPLAFRADDVEDLYRIAQPSTVPSLSLMAMPAVEEIKGDKQTICSFAQRIAPLSAHFDLCLVDASHAGDLALAASSAEAAILAIRRDGTMTASLKATMHKLSILKMPIMGTVMFV
ncbi:hypothetical protein [Sphingobium bisphenolivorans]|uniref:hypothetical protein n=1 Tax=Sphingobium bisphenolivorans TaxID=1335760 RepID=UPI0003A986CE|nr:hypothetical protein [Sphingobium bisphenolivorans]